MSTEFVRAVKWSGFQSPGLLKKANNAMSSTSVVFAICTILSGILTAPVQSYGMERASSIRLTRTIITLKRVKTTDGAVIGKLFVNNDLECYTLESADFIIPTGTYTLTRQFSSKFNHEVLILWGVVGRSGIEIHPGNTKEDAKGCILVGRSHTDRSVIASRGALTHLLKRLQLPAVIVIQDAQL